MVSDKILGGLMLVGGVVVFILYAWALFFAGEVAWWYAISIVAIVAVGAVCVIIAWVGYTLLTTPTPSPVALEPEPETSEAKGEKGEEAK
ncbi:MAG: transcriptional regulator [Candidatus Bathyarchaeota archaeon]|nr:transcriptional regulator [Candidatus Bathyarchaeota archaeon]